jgi:hypothetical protein
MKTIHYRGEVTKKMLTTVDNLVEGETLYIDGFEESKRLKKFASEFSDKWDKASNINYIARQNHFVMAYMIKNNG